MKRLFNKSTFLLLSISLLWSCESFLEIDPKDGQTSEADFFKTKEDFDSFIFGAYSEMAGFNDNRGSVNWIITPGYVSQDLIGSDETPKNLSAFMTANNGAFKEHWTTFYKIATRANTVLSKVADAPISDTDKTFLEGEAKFLRGFAYFNLARAYGDVPLVTTVYTFEQNKLSCTPEAQVWDQVIADLSDASLKLLKRSNLKDEDVGRATQGSALAFLANAYMYKEDWANAASASAELIALGDYDLLTDVRFVFSETNPNNIESIFEVQYRGTSDGNFVWSGQPNLGNVLPLWTAPRNIGEAYAPSGGWGETIATKTLANSFEASDDRRKKLIRVPGERYKGENMSDSLLIPLTVSQANSAFSTKYWLGPSTTSGQTFLHGQNVPLMRYAEFLLNYAEILFEQGQSAQAYQQLNLVRQRSKLLAKTASADKETFMTDLMRERRAELNFEPNLWFHYTRTERASKFLLDNYGITMEAKWNKFPVPQGERDQNPNLCQTVGY